MNLWFLATVFLGSLVLSSVTVAWSIRLAHKWGRLDHPDGGRKIQARPIPKLGGLAVAATFTVAALVVLVLAGDAQHIDDAVGILVPAFAAAILGYVDDVKPISPRIRLILQAIIGGLVWILGSRIALTGIWWVDLLLTVVWVVVIVNGINLLDNSDGMAGATVYVSAAGATCVAFIFGQDYITPLAVAVCGVSAGFLVHNWYPARVYMGDSGAYFLGVLLATLVIRLRPQDVSGWAGLVIAILLVLLPLADTTFVVARRLRAGIHPFTAGRDHLSHQLQARGASVPASVVTLEVGLILSSLAAVVIAVIVDRG